MQVFNTGNCISDNYNLFLFECTGFHFKLMLLTLQTLLAGLVSQGLVDFETRLADSDLHLPNEQDNFLEDQKKCVTEWTSQTEKWTTEFSVGLLKYWVTN